MPASPAAGGRAARLGALDALRFLAALSVVAFHFTGISPAWDGPAPSDVRPLARLGAYGAMGVPMFFVISGFVVLMTAWGRDVPHFVASRIGRLFPAYWAAVLLAVLFAFVIWPAGSIMQGAAPTKPNALVNLTMLQGAIGVPDITGAFWTLWTEARFYALLAVFILVGISRRRVLAFATLWPIAGAIAMRSDEPLLSTILIADYAPYFAGGMLLYVLYRDGNDLLTWLLVGVQSLLALHFALGYYPAALAGATGVPVSKALVALVSLGCFGAVALVSLTRLNRGAKTWMTTLGALTYPLYLVHEKVGHYVIHVVRGEASPWLALAAGLLASLLVATALHRLVEKRYGATLRAAVLRALQQPRERTAPVVAPPHSTPLPHAPVMPAVHTTATPDAALRRGGDHRVPAPAGARD